MFDCDNRQVDMVAESQVWAQTASRWRGSEVTDRHWPGGVAAGGCARCPMINSPKGLDVGTGAGC